MKPKHLSSIINALAKATSSANATRPSLLRVFKREVSSIEDPEISKILEELKSEAVLRENSAASLLKDPLHQRHQEQAQFTATHL